jgi:hypothetical protein
MIGGKEKVVRWWRRSLSRHVVAFVRFQGHSACWPYTPFLRGGNTAVIHRLVTSMTTDLRIALKLHHENTLVEAFYGVSDPKSRVRLHHLVIRQA